MPPFPELRDITPPVEPPDPTQVVIWSLFGGIVALGLFFSLMAWVRWLRRHPRLPGLPLSPDTAALRELGALRTLAQTLAPSELASAVSESIRHYLLRRRGMLARYRTTEELVGPIDGGDGPPPLPFVRRFEPVLRRCDLLKYGGANSTPTAGVSLVDEAVAAVTQDDDAHSKMPPPVPKSGNVTWAWSGTLPDPDDASTPLLVDGKLVGVTPSAAAVDLALPRSELPSDPPPLSESVLISQKERALHMRPLNSNSQGEIRSPALPPGPPPLPANAPAQADSFTFHPHHESCAAPVPY